MMLAAKHLDIVLGIDIHIVMVPAPPAPPIPVPIPHPFVGMVFDPMDWIPITIMIPKSAAEAMAAGMGAVESGIRAVGIDMGAQSSTAGDGGGGSGGTALMRVAQGANRAEGGEGGEGEAPKPPQVNPDNFAFGSSAPDAVAIPLNASIWVNGMPRGNAGTNGKGGPHTPIGGPMFQRANIAFEDSACELLMGSKTVLADGSPFTYMGLPTLSCTCIGAPPPPHPPDEPEAGFFLPVSVILPIPAGQTVLVGGPPTVNWMALAFKLPGALKKLAKSKLFKSLANKAKSGIGKALKFLKCKIFGEPVEAVHGKVVVKKIDFELPGPIPLIWERFYFSTSDNEGPLGHGWHWKYDLFLKYDLFHKCLIINLEEGRKVDFPTLEPGEKAYIREEKLELRREGDHYVLRDENRLDYWFEAPPGGREVIQRLQRISNGAWFKIQFEYDLSGHLRQVIDSAGRQLRISCDRNGRIKSVEAPHPEKKGETFPIVRYEYDHQGNLTKAINALGHALAYNYQGNLLIQHTDRNGLSFYYKYDGVGHDARCIHAWGDGGLYDTKFEYNIEEQWTLVENSLGHRTKLFWNDDGVVYRTVDPLGYAETTQFGAYNQELSETDKLGRVTRYSYDDFGNRTGVQYPDGSSISMQYENNLLVGAVDQNGGKWQWEFDPDGQLIQRVDPLGQQTQFQYENGLLKKIIDAADRITSLEYDAYFNLALLVSPDGSVSRWEYDLLGRCIKTSDPKGNTQICVFNMLDWVQRVEEPDGNIRLLEYDAEGNVTRARDKHHDVRFEYSGLNSLKARIEAGTRVEFTYNTEEDLTGIVNEHGFAYRFGLDARGDVVTESGFDGLTRKYVRDAGGRVREIQRPGGGETRYEYDAQDRITQVNYSDDTSEKYVYRADGELIEATNQHVITKFERDSLGRVIKEMQGGFVIDSVFDVFGMRTEVRSSLGAHLTFGRNLMGDVESVNANGAGKPWEAAFKRDGLGLEIERMLPGGVRSRWERDKMGRPVKQETFAGGNKPARTRAYTWDVNDRLSQITDSQKGVFKFEHDVLGNLSSAKYGDGAFEFRMPDAVGNLFRNQDRKDRKYGPAGQLLEANGTRYEYDAEGNLTQKTSSNGAVWRYEWTAAGQLRRVVRPDGDTVTFTYDALGRRISKQYRGKTTCWVWDGNNMLHEWIEIAPESGKDDEAPAMTAIVGGAIKIKRRDDQLASAPAHAPPLTAPQEQIASFQRFENITTWVFEPESFTPLAKLSENAQYSIVTDHLGTPVSMFSERGEKVWDMDLSIYGEVRNLEGWREACPFRYPGQYEDVETGLYYNRFRYYDLKSGNFISQDPIGLAGGNPTLYGYVFDSNTQIDPFGLDLITVYHYTSKKGYNAIRSQNPIKLKANSPIKGHPRGVYVTTKSPEMLSQSTNGYKKLGLTSEKSSHFFEFQIDDSKLKSIKGDRGDFIKYIEGDLEIPKDKIGRIGKTPCK